MLKISACDISYKNYKQITILFADIVRSSDIVRELPPETADEIFNQVILRQIEITRKFQGTVNQVMGDGIMCLFGAVSPYEEHALRALEAGKEMLESILSIQKKYKGIQIRIRIGINTGEALITKADNNDYRAFFQVVGEAVHISDRVLKQAGINQIVVSESTKNLLGRYYNFKKTGHLLWHPEREPINIYESVSLKAVSSPHAELDNKYTSRLSFENKMEALLDPLRTEKISPVIWLQGDAGMGKTYLLNNFLQKHSKQRFDKIIQINFYPEPVSNDRASFEYTVIESLIGINGADTPDNIQQEYPFFRDCLKEILGQACSDTYLSLDAVTRSRLRAETISRLLLSAAQHKRILLILEDAHWAKEDSLAYIENLLRLHDGRGSLLIAATSRKSPPFDKHICESKISRLLLDPLSIKETGHMLERLDEQRCLPPALKKKLHRLSNGSPYFINEYFDWVQTLLSRGLPLHDINKKLDDFTPGNISDILYNKLSSINDHALQTIKIAAILGMRINFDILQALRGIKRKELAACLLSLEDAGVIRKHRDFPVREWVFTHELLQKVIYHSVSKPTRTQWHHTVVEQLRKPAFKDIDNKYLILASHAEKSENSLLKYLYAKWAAGQESLLSRYQSSIKLSLASRQALANIAGLKDPEKHEIQAHLLEIKNLFIIGKYSQVQKHIDILLGKKGALIRLGYLDRVLSLKELYLWIKGDLTGAAKIGQTILSLDPQNTPLETYIRENARLANLYIDLGQYKKAITHDLRVVEAIPDACQADKFHLLVQAKPASLSCLALTYAETGNLAKSQEYFKRAHDTLENNPDYFTKIYVLVYLAHSLIVQNKNKEAQNLLKSALAYCEKVGSSLLKPYVLSAYGGSLARTGKPEEGIRLCKEALDQAAQNKLVLRSSQFTIWYAEALMAQGQYSPGIKHLKQAIAAAAPRSEKGCLANAYYLLAKCYLEKSAENKKPAETYLQQALKMAKEGHMKTIEKNIFSLMRESALSQKLVSAVIL